ncbi:GntR family transcriptional regulator [Microbacterium sp. NEAU-LLC]|uniref:GntR family transcriptional regulator n=1 Tax=Microbacterium helvum TaxID=2773713 RepID=A0ABR8NPY5_9MICO|nr:GntR family transcriptional regulator [Microbacterium helvum]MBD3942058.1 GntR family transcriptional regulator [Microbacterium helvum]
MTDPAVAAPADIAPAGPEEGGEGAEALADSVYGALLRDIVGDELRPGTWLKERELSERYGVSRVPVRQALHRLESEGFVRASPRRGAVVSPVTTADIDELFDARLCIEPFAARQAALRVAAGGSAARLADVLAASEASFAEGDDRDGITLNLRFHAEVLELSGNSLLARSLQPMLGRMEWIFRRTSHAGEPDQLREHRALHDAIAAGNADLAAAIAYAHIERGRVPALEALGPLPTP